MPSLSLPQLQVQVERERIQSVLSVEKSREARAMQLPLTSAEGVEKEERM